MERALAGDQSTPSDDFWANVLRIVLACQNAKGIERETAWRQLSDVIRPWTRTFAHRRGSVSPSEKEGFCAFMLSWLALPGRLSSFDANRGRFFAWYSNAMKMGHAEWCRQEHGCPGEEFGQVDNVPAPDGIEESLRDAREVLVRLPVALRVAFKVIHHSTLGPLDEIEQSEFCRAFGSDYAALKDELDSVSGVDAAQLLGKSPAWAYQVRHRALQRLQEVGDE